MPKLHYKEHKKKDKDKHRSDKTHKSHRKKKSYYKPPVLDENEGWEPNLASIKSEEEEWRQHLFDAMMEDEGQDAYYSNYSQPVPKEDTMTDEEYRQHIVSGMFKRTHAEEIAAEEKRKAHKEKKRKERAKQKAKLEQEEAERLRIHAIYAQLEDVKKKSLNKEDYVERWKRLDGLTQVTRKDIPWPLVGKTFSLESVRAFVLDDKLSPAENKKNVRKEQLKYHPDKFISRVMNRFQGTEKEKQRILTQVNDISGWLNEL
jgi:hypothetical protein